MAPEVVAAEEAILYIVVAVAVEEVVCRIIIAREAKITA